MKLSLLTLSLLLPGASCINITIASGAPVVLWSAVDTLHKCGIIDVPDIPLRVFSPAAGDVRAVVGSTSYHRMNGSSIFNLSRECTAAWNQTGDPDPSHFAGDEFLDSTWYFPNNTVYSLIHTEFPGNVYKNCTGPAYPHCWTVTIGLGVSFDGGSTWQHARPPPAHLVAAVPYGYNESQLASGWGDPSNIILKDGFFYAAIWNRNVVGLQAPGVCMMRTADLADPSSWRAWDGAGYTVPFASPYTLPPGTEGRHVCTVTNLPLGCPVGGMAWSAALQLYVASLDCSLQGGAHFYYATSPDLIRWSAPATLYTHSDLPANASKVVTSMSYPTWVDPDPNDPNFGTLSAEPWLSWVSIGHSPYTDGRKLWATQFRIQA